MHYTHLTLTVPSHALDAASEIALLAAPGGMYIEDYRSLEADALAVAHSDLIDEALLQMDRGVGRIHLYLPPQEPPAEAAAFLEERLAALGVDTGIALEDCRSEDWENSWKAYFHPIPAGGRLLIQPAWEEYEPEAWPGRVPLWLEPGAAFGSGSHATTRLCLEALEDALDSCFHSPPVASRHLPQGGDMDSLTKADVVASIAPPGEMPEGQRGKENSASNIAVLDIGCGSGILAVAALLLGAERAVGVDIDPLAVSSARENGLRNGFGPPALTVLEGNLAEQATGQFDVVVSNIVADAILALAGSAARRLKPGGVWISSGIIDTRAEEVMEGLQACGWRVVGRRGEGGWVCLLSRTDAIS